MTGPWTDEELEFLAYHYNRGFTATEIGGVLKRTKNSVIGMANRCGMQLPDCDWENGADPITPEHIQLGCAYAGKTA